MIWRADVKEVQRMVDGLVKGGMDQDQAIDTVRQAEVCNCRKPMRFEDGRWWCDGCGNSRFEG